MKKIILFAAPVCMLTLSCSKEVAQTPFPDSSNLVTDTFTISIDTKSTIDSDNKVSWSKDDKIYYFSDCEYNEEKEAYTSTEKRNVAVLADGASVGISLQRAAKDNFYALIFPGEDGKTYNAVQDYNLKQFGYSGINPVQSGTFAFANIAVAYADLSNGVPEDLTFKNISSAVKFELEQADLSGLISVELATNNAVEGEEINGRINVDLTAEEPVASYRLYYPGGSGKQYSSKIELTEDAKPGLYYFAVMPTTLTKGFTMKFNKKYTTLTAGTNSEVTFGRCEIKNVGKAFQGKKKFASKFVTNDIATDNNWETGKKIASFTVDNLATVTATGDNGYYFYNETTPANSDFRIYQARSNGEFEIKSLNGRPITAVTFNYGNKNNGVIKYGDTVISSGAKYTFEDAASDTRVFTVGSSAEGTTNGQARITKFNIECN